MAAALPTSSPRHPPRRHSALVGKNAVTWLHRALVILPLIDSMLRGISTDRAAVTIRVTRGAKQPLKNPLPRQNEGKFALARKGSRPQRSIHRGTVCPVIHVGSTFMLLLPSLLST